MDKFLKISFIFAIVFLLCGCEVLTSKLTTENITSNPETTLSITTDNRHNALEEEYLLISSQLPYSFTSNVILPSSSNTSILIEYYLNDELLSNNTLYYQKLSYDYEIDLVIRFQFVTVIVTKNFVILQIRDESLYNQAQIDLVFESTLATLQTTLPKTLSSDFTVPSYDILGVSVELIIPTNYEIINNRFIYPYPETVEIFEINAKVTYQNAIRFYEIPITILPITALPKIPEIHITTQNNKDITSKEEYVSGRLTLKVFDDNLNESTPITNASMQIRFRGNSSFYMPKKPYKIKFTTKTALLSDYAQKDWVLLANFTDQTLIRNYLAYNLARDIGMEFSPMAKFVDVFINGVFQGNYLLSDQIEASPNRVNVEEGSSLLDTGYLIEYDKRLYDFDLSTVKENYFILYGVPFVIKSPSSDDSFYSINQKYYIEDYLKTVYDTLYSKRDYTKLIDEKSFIDWFIVEEVFKNVDSGFSSVFMYKNKGGLLKMGPVWDFDLSTGNQGHEQDPNMRGPEGWYTALEYKNIFYYYLMQYPSFRRNLKNRWNEIYESHILELLNNIYSASDSITKSRYENFLLWDIIGKNTDWYTAPEILEITTYEGQVLFLYHYLETRIEWLNQAINHF